MPMVELTPVPVEEALMMDSQDRWDWLMETYFQGQEIDLSGRLTGQQLAEIAEIGKTDLFFFCTVILGYSRLGLTGFHFEMCRFIEDGADKARNGSEWHGFINVPREHFKTTIAVIGRGLQRIVEDVTKCQLITSATSGVAKATVSVMKDHIDNNDVFKRVYPYVKPNRKHWKTAEFRVQQPKGTPYRREPTVMSLGVGGTPESYHFDYISQDDLVTRKNCESDTKKKKVKSFYGLAQALLNEGGEEIITGTRFADDDLYGWMLSEDNETDIEIFPYHAVEVDGEFIFPEEWGDDRIEQRKMKMTVYDLSCQYYNDTTPKELRRFDEDEILRMRGSKMPETTNYLGIDPSTGLGEDPSGLVVVGIDDDRTVYVKHAIRSVMSWGDICEMADELNKEYNLAHVLVETYGQGKAILSTFEKWQQDHDSYWIYDGHSGSKSSKTMRIMTTLQPLYHSGKVVHNTLLKGSAMERQLLNLGTTDEDDLADALYLAVFDARLGGYIGVSSKRRNPETIVEKAEAGAPLTKAEKINHGPTMETENAFTGSNGGSFL